jgi:hypothetical protein
MLCAASVCANAVGMDEPQRVPSLDELLGLPDQEQSEDTTKIDQALSPQQAGEAFTQAVGLMEGVADRIDTENDTGLITQRMQEDIIRKLEQVIESAQQNQSSSNSSSSSSSSSASGQQQPNQQSQQSNTPSTGEGEPSDGSTPPGSNEAGSNNMSTALARWGHLPERLRDALSQGLDEPYSQLYRRLTEQYYKTLAEDDE